jgi:hypothetical protein
VTAGGQCTANFIYTVTPDIPGDSGSGFLNGSGQAIGVLSTVALAPLAGSNGVGDLSRELAYARAHGLADLQVVNGTEPFTGRSSGRANGSPRQTSAIPAQVAMAQP